MPDAEIDNTFEADISSLKTGMKEHVSIICHDKPDSDCLASAMGLQAIAEHLGLKSTIYWGGDITHTQNRVMMNVLNIHTIKLDKDDENTESIKKNLESSYIILVDTPNFGTANCLAISDFVTKDRKPDLIIDHHDLSATIDKGYIWYQYGSCSTIVYKMLNLFEVPIDSVLATALYIGITIDTDNLKSEGTTKEDEDVYLELKSLIDPDKYLKIFNYPKPFALINLRKKFYNTCCTEGASLIVANVGVINPQQQSLMAELCEEMLDIESIDTSVVLGIVDEGFEKPKYIVASFRSKTLSIDTKEFIQKVFLKKDGKKNVAASGGGRRGAGRAEIKLDQIISECLDSLSKNEEDKIKYETFINMLFDTYKNRIKVEREKI